MQKFLQPKLRTDREEVPSNMSSLQRYQEIDDHICKKSTIITSSELSSMSKHDHRKDIVEHFSIYQ